MHNKIIIRFKWPHINSPRINSRFIENAFTMKAKPIDMQDVFPNEKYCWEAKQKAKNLTIDTCFWKESHECPFSFMTAPHLPSQDLGEIMGWCTMHLQRRPEWRNFFEQQFYFVSFHWGDVCCQPLSSLLVLQGQKWMSMVSTTGPLIDRLLNCS